jgi:hypothetical protein
MRAGLRLILGQQVEEGEKQHRGDSREVDYLTSFPPTSRRPAAT